MKKTIYLLLIITIIVSPLLARADGGVIRPLPDGDFVWVEENSQQAFINYEQGIEKLIIGVDIKEENSDIVWIIPIPSEPEKVAIDIVSELPFFFGDDVISKAKIKLSENLKVSYYASLLGQIWTFPFGIAFLGFLSGGRGGSSGEMPSGDLVLVESHIEKAGMIAEVITAKDGQAIYNYFSQKGFDIKEGSISELNYYIEKDYSFVVSWIVPEATNQEIISQRGIFISFPTSKIYYPLMLTSAYGDLEIPIIIRVLDHVKPEIFSEIKPYTKVNYFTEGTKRYGTAREAKCQADMAQFRTIMQLYYDEHNSYPSSLQKLLNDKNWGDFAEELIKDIVATCQEYPLYLSKHSKDYTMILKLPSGGLFEINSSGFASFVQEKKELISFSLELEKFYGDKKPWKGEAEYTKITINAPAKLLKKDLWMESGKPFKISFAFWVINNPVIVTIFLYLLIVAVTSFIAGGLTGLICYRKFKKYALVGLGNLLTLIGLILIFNYVRKKKEEDFRYYSEFVSFEFLFSTIFIFLLIFLPLLNLVLLEQEVWAWLVLPYVAGGIAIAGGILFLIRFILNKIGLKNGIPKAILTIILFIIFLIIIGFLIFRFLIL